MNFGTCWINFKAESKGWQVEFMNKVTRLIQKKFCHKTNSAKVAAGRTFGPSGPCDYTDEDITMIIDDINHTLRKSLGFFTPQEQFSALAGNQIPVWLPLVELNVALDFEFSFFINLNPAGIDVPLSL